MHKNFSTAFSRLRLGSRASRTREECNPPAKDARRCSPSSFPLRGTADRLGRPSAHIRAENSPVLAAGSIDLSPFGDDDGAAHAEKPVTARIYGRAIWPGNWVAGVSERCARDRCTLPEFSRSGASCDSELEADEVAERTGRLKVLESFKWMFLT